MLEIDVALTAMADAAAVARGPVILVEPLYGGVAVTAALDAGWGSVLVDAGSPDDSPLPLVSFEQAPPSGHAGGRCRVPASDLLDAALGIEPDGANLVLVGGPTNARPLASMLAACTETWDCITLVPAAAAGTVSADALWAAGVVIRILLEELEDRASRLTDFAGVAVTLATGAEDPRGHLGAGERWRRHLERGGHPDDLRVASAIDSFGVVPRVAAWHRDDRAVLVEPWTPTAAGR